MKKTLFILLAALLTFSLSLNAQVKKATAKKATTTKKAPAKTTTTSKSNSEPVEEKKSNEPAQSKKAENNTTETKKAEQKESSKSSSVFGKGTAAYKAAIGIKFLWGISLTGKYFFKDNQAIEAILRYRGLGGVGSDIGLAALYQYHGDINGVDGLRYYFGGGPYVGHTSIKDRFFNEYVDNNLYNNTYFGISAVIGAEYKFEDLPIAISADWMPSFNFNGGGFGAENGGFGVKYTF